MSGMGVLARPIYPTYVGLRSLRSNATLLNSGNQNTEVAPQPTYFLFRLTQAMVPLKKYVFE